MSALRRHLLVFRAVSAAFVCSGMWFVPAAAAADEETKTELDATGVATARRLFDEAIALADAHEWSEAASKLRQAISIKDTPGLRFHLAHAEDMLGHLVQADREYERARELIASGMSAPDVERLLAPAAAALRERVPTVMLRVKDVPSASVSIDGRSVDAASIGTAIPLDPGKHRIVVTSAERRPFDVELSLEEGEDRVIEAVLEPLESRASANGRTTKRAPPADTHAEPSPEAEYDSSGGFGAREAVLVGEGGIVAVGLGLGIVYFFKARSAENRADRLGGEIDEIAKSQGKLPKDYETECTLPSPPPECADLRKAVDDQRTATTLSTVGFVVAGVGAAAAVGTWLLWPDDAGDARVGLIVTPKGAVSSLRIRF